MPSKYGFETVDDKQSRQRATETLLTSLAPQIGQLVVDVLKDFSEAKGWYRAEVIGEKDKDQARWVWRYRISPEFRSSLVSVMSNSGPSTRISYLRLMLLNISFSLLRSFLVAVWG